MLLKVYRIFLDLTLSCRVETKRVPFEQSLRPGATYHLLPGDVPNKHGAQTVQCIENKSNWCCKNEKYERENGKVALKLVLFFHSMTWAIFYSPHSMTRASLYSSIPCYLLFYDICDLFNYPNKTVIFTNVLL